MKGIIERLKKEKEQNRIKWFDIGREAGLRWAKLSSYEALKFIGTWKPDVIPMRPLIEIEESNEDWFQENVFEVVPKPLRGSEAYSLFQAGFVQAAKQFWNEVNDKI